MYLRRKIDDYLTHWKNDKHRKPLLLRGARQVGKTFSVRKLSEQFDHFIEVNFEENKDAHNVFKGNLEPKELSNNLSLLYDAPIIEGKTLLFFDEIQACHSAISSLRFFYEKMPNLHLIAAGSLLEFALAELPSFGVGRVRSVFMYPFSFDEFLLALGLDRLMKAKQEASAAKPLDGPIHNRLVQLNKTFIIVGGMPEVVLSYVQNEDIRGCRAALDDLIISFQADFVKYKTRIPAIRILNVFESIVHQIGGKFIYSKVSDSYSTKQTKEVIDLLIMAHLIVPVTHSSCNGLPLGAEANIKKQKLILIDTGLTQRMLNLNLSSLMFSDDFDTINKGSIAEQYVGLELIKNTSPYHHPVLYYWHRESRNSAAEVDYVVQLEDKIRAIEVKSGVKGKMHSLRVFLKEKSSNFGYRISLENYASYDDIRVVPLYAVDSLSDK